MTEAKWSNGSKKSRLLVATLLSLVVTSCASDKQSNGDLLRLELSSKPEVGSPFALNIVGGQFKSASVSTTANGLTVDMCRPSSSPQRFECISPSPFSIVRFAASVDVGSGVTVPVYLDSPVIVASLRFALEIKDRVGSRSVASNESSLNEGSFKFASGQISFKFLDPTLNYRTTIGSNTFTQSEFQHDISQIGPVLIDVETSAGSRILRKAFTLLIQCADITAPVKISSIAAVQRAGGAVRYTPTFDRHSLGFKLDVNGDRVLDTQSWITSSAFDAYPLYQGTRKLSYLTLNECGQVYAGEVPVNIPIPSKDTSYLELAIAGLGDNAERASNVNPLTGVPTSAPAQDPQKYTFSCTQADRGNSGRTVMISAMYQPDVGGASSHRHGAYLTLELKPLPTGNEWTQAYEDSFANPIQYDTASDEGLTPKRYYINSSPGSVRAKTELFLKNPGICTAQGKARNEYAVILSGQLNPTSLVDRATAKQVSAQGSFRCVSPTTVARDENCIPTPSCSITQPYELYEGTDGKFRLDLVGASRAQVRVGDRAPIDASVGYIAVTPGKVGTLPVLATVTNEVGTSTCKIDLVISPKPGPSCQIYGSSSAIAGSQYLYRVESRNLQDYGGLASVRINGELVSDSKKWLTFTDDSVVSAEITTGSGETVTCPSFPVTVIPTPAGACTASASPGYAEVGETVDLSAIINNGAYHNWTKKIEVTIDGATEELPVHNTSARKFMSFSTVGYKVVSFTIYFNDGTSTSCKVPSLLVVEPPPTTAASCVISARNAANQVIACGGTYLLVPGEKGALTIKISTSHATSGSSVGLDGVTRQIPFPPGYLQTIYDNSVLGVGVKTITGSVSGQDGSGTCSCAITMRPPQ